MQLQALTCSDSLYLSTYSSVSESLRGSKYFTGLPKLPVSSLELDGDVTNLPVIYEDIYGGDCDEDITLTNASKLYKLGLCIV